MRNIKVKAVVAIFLLVLQVAFAQTKIPWEMIEAPGVVLNALQADLSNATETVDTNGVNILKNVLGVKGDYSINVRDYGAVPDNYEDDYSAFNAAVSQLSDGAILRVPPGLYHTSDSIHINGKDDITIDFQGRIAPIGGATEIFRVTTGNAVRGMIRVGDPEANHGSVQGAVALGALDKAQISLDIQGYSSAATETAYVYTVPNSAITINGTTYYYNEAGIDIVVSIGSQGSYTTVDSEKLDMISFLGDTLQLPGNLRTNGSLWASDLYLNGGNVVVTDGNIATNQVLSAGQWAKIAGILFADGGIRTTNISASGEIDAVNLRVGGVEIIPGGEISWGDITGTPTNASYTLSGLSEKNFSSLDGKPTNASYTLADLAEKNYSSLVGTPTNASYTLSGLSEKNYKNLTNKPTSSSWNFYGITNKRFEYLENKPTTLAGYGITDAYSIANAPQMERNRIVIAPEDNVPAQIWLSPHSPGNNPLHHYVRLVASVDNPNALILQNGVGNERARMTPGGNFLLGTSADGGYRLLVNGDAKADSVYTHKIAYPVTESTRFEIESDKLQAFVNNTSAFKVEAGKIETHLPVSQQETTIASATMASATIASATIDRLEVAVLIADIPPATASSVLADYTGSSSLPIAFKHPDYGHDRSLDSGIYSPGYGQLAFWINSPSANLPWLRMFYSGGELAENVNNITKSSDSVSGILYSGGSITGGGTVYLGPDSSPYVSLSNGSKKMITTYGDIVSVGTIDWDDNYLLLVGGQTLIDGRVDVTGGLNLSRSSPPAGAKNGDIYYDSTTHKFRGYANGSWVDLN